MDAARIESTHAVMASSPGLWAGQQFSKYGLKTSALRTYDVLREDEWKLLIDQVVEEGQIRLRAVQDLVAAGLTRDVANPLGKTEIKYERVSDVHSAERSMSGVARTQSDTPDYTGASVPNFITHVDFPIDRRLLEASRERGEPIDATNARQASRRVAESLEDALLNGSGVTVDGKTAYGYRNHPNRNTGSFGANGAWHQAAKGGDDILKDVFTMTAALRAARFYGPYWIYVPTDVENKLDDDFKAESDLTIRQRLLQMESIAAIRVADQLPSANVIAVDPKRDVVEMADGEGISPVTWEIAGGFTMKMKVWALQVPLVKSTHAGRSGIYHMS